MFTVDDFVYLFSEPSMQPAEIYDLSVQPFENPIWCGPLDEVPSYLLNATIESVDAIPFDGSRRLTLNIDTTA